MIVKQVSICLDLFELFRRIRAPMTLTRLSEELGQPRSSSFNLIETLRLRGYLHEVAPRSGYYPSRRMLEVMQDIVRADAVTELIHPFLADLAEETGETVLLGAIDGAELIYLDAIESSLPVRYAAQSGQRRPYYATSGGKAILSEMPPAALKKFLADADFSDRTDRTLSGPEELIADIEAGRARGWFSNRSEYTADVTGIGLPLTVDGRVLAVSVAGPNYRVADREAEFAAAIGRTRQLILDRFAGEAST